MNKEALEQLEAWIKNLYPEFNMDDNGFEIRYFEYLEIRDSEGNEIDYINLKVEDELSLKSILQKFGYYDDIDDVVIFKWGESEDITLTWTEYVSSEGEINPDQRSNEIPKDTNLGSLFKFLQSKEGVALPPEFEFIEKGIYTLKDRFLTVVKYYYPDFDPESDSITIGFSGGGDNFDSFTDVVITSKSGTQKHSGYSDGIANKDEFLYKLIEASGVAYNWNNAGTQGAIEYSGDTGELIVKTEVGEQDYDQLN